MASSTRVHTVHDPSQPETPQQTQSGDGGTDQKPGANLSDSPLPPAQAPPPEAPKPLSNEEFLKQNPKPSKEEREAFQKEFDAYQTWTNYKKDKNEVENMRRKHAEEPLFGGQDVLNKDEAVRDYMDEMALLLRTEANQEEKRHSYLYLCQLLDGNNYPDLRDLCEHNTRRLLKWANGGYKGPQPKLEYYDEEGKITNTPSQKRDAWAENKRRTEDAPEESPVTLPSEPYMSRIKGLWEEGTPMLHEALKNPEQIRAQPGLELNRINKQINQVKNEFVRSADDKGQEEKEKVKGIPDLSIPVGEVLMMVVRYTEQAVRENKMDFKDDPAVKSDLAYITTKANRAGQGDAWIKNMEEAYTHHVGKAAELWASGADSLEKIHAREEFWNRDLLDWIMTQYMASAPSQEAPAEWRSAETASQPDSDRMSVDGNAQPAIGESSPAAPPGSSTSPNPACPSTATASGTSTSTRSLPPQKSTGSVLTQTVLYKRERRRIGGVRDIGKGRYQYLVQVNAVDAANPFWHIVGSYKIVAPGDPQKYLRSGGFLVRASVSTKDEEKGNSVEGNVEHLEKHQFSDFRMKGIAVAPRESGEGYQNNAMQVIQGYFEGEDPMQSKFYTFSTLVKAFKRKHVLQEAIDEHMKENNFPFQAKPLERPTTRRRRGKRSNKDESEGEGEDIEYESDGPLDQNDGIYDNDDQSEFIEPASTVNSSTRKPQKGDGRQRGGDYFNAAFVIPNSKSRSSPTDSNQPMEGFKKSIMEHVDKRIDQQIKTFEGGMDVRFSRMEDMMSAMMAKMAKL